MPSEIFAEDIEALLERLEGVTSARVVANDSGEIERVYVTASPEGDDRSVRRMIASALMSQYSLAIDGWRIQVAHLREDEAPRLRRWDVARVEEVTEATSVSISVELRAVGSERPRLVGRASGGPDAVGRAQAAAQAVLNALKPGLAREGRKATVETVAIVPLRTAAAAVVAIATTWSAQAELTVGAAIAADNSTEAIIAATLEAVSKSATSSRGGGGTMKDRRQQLEALRAYYDRQREPQRDLPALSEQERAGGGDPAEERSLRPGIHPGGGGEGADGGDPAEQLGPPSAPPPQDEASDVHSLTQIRPERQGGAAVGARSDVSRPPAGAQTRPTPKGAMEDEFYRTLAASRTPVHIRCRDGYEIARAVIKDFGTFSLLVQTSDGDELVFKHGIIAIRPVDAESG